MSGLLGKRNLVAGVPQSVYLCGNDRATVVSISLCNRTADPVRVSIAVTESESVIADKEYIEFKTTIGPNGVLERTSIYVSPYYYVTVISEEEGVSAVCWGVESGDPVSITAIGDATNVGPVWQTSAGNLGTVIEGLSLSTPITLFATDPGGAEVTYTSSNLTTGLTLSTLDSDVRANNYIGQITGTPAAGGTYNAAGLTDSFQVVATDAAGGTTSRTFNVLRKFRDGSTPELAAVNADEIYNLSTDFQSTAANGWFWISGQETLGYELNEPKKYYCNFNGAGYMMWMHYRDPHGGRGPEIAVPQPYEDREFSLSDNQEMFSHEVPVPVVRSCTRVWLNSNLDSNPETPAFGDFKYGVVIDPNISTWITGPKTARRGFGMYPYNGAGVSEGTIFEVGAFNELNENNFRRLHATDLPNYRFGSNIGTMQYGHNHGGGNEFETLNFRNLSGSGSNNWSTSSHIWERSGWGAIDASIFNNVNSGWGSNGDDRNGSWNRTDRLFAWLR